MAVASSSYRDRLDLSLWSGLYAVSALSILPTSDGAIVGFRDERLEIATASGSPLGPGDFTEAGTLGVTRVPLSPIAPWARRARIFLLRS